MIITIPYNSFCKINEIFNETLKLCVNKTINFTNYDNISNHTHRQLQMQGDRLHYTTDVHATYNMPSSPYLVRLPNTKVLTGRIDGFQNMYSRTNILSNEIYLLIIIFFGFMTYNYTKQIKKFLNNL